MTEINNRYHIRECLGEGGMGKVYLVEDQVFEDQLRALKTLRKEEMSQAQVRAFQNEFQILSSIRHPYIEEVFDYGEIHWGPDSDEGSYFFTSEYIEGNGIAEKLEPENWEQLFEFSVQICRALQFLHSRGLIHYDVKPDNLLVTADSDPRVKLIDFGLAAYKETEEGDRIRGTAPYIAPEIIRKQEVDHRVDLYSLGVTLYELAIGERPFQASNTQSILQDHLHTDPPDPEEYAQDIPEKFRHLIQTLMSKDADARLASARDVIQRISECAGKTYQSEVRDTLQGYVSSTDFVGRDKELEELKNVWRYIGEKKRELPLSSDVIDFVGDDPSDPHFVLVSGESGIGKSRLLQEFRIWAQIQSIPVFQEQVNEGAQEVFGGFRNIVKQFVRWVESFEQMTESMDEKLTARYAPYLKTILPEIENQYDVRDPYQLDDEEAEQSRLLDQISNYMIESASSDDGITGKERETSGVVFIIEDLHWADEMSLRLLETLVRKTSLQHDSNRLMILGTARTEEEHSLFEQMTGHLRDQGHIIDLTLAPFTRKEMMEYVTGICGEAGEQLMNQLGNRDTSGNPFFIQEMLRTCVDEGILYCEGASWKLDAGQLQELDIPNSLERLVERRVAGLDQGEIEILERLSIWGGSIQLYEMEEIFGEDQVVSETSINRLINRGVLRAEQKEAAKQLRMAHEQFSRHFHQRLQKENRWEPLHRSLFERLERWCEQEAEQKQDQVERLARLAWEAGMVDKFQKYGFEAVDHAREQYANERAIQYLRNLLDTNLSEEKYRETREELGDFLKVTGELEEAQYEYRQISVEQPADPADIRRIRKLGEVTKSLGEVDRAESLFQRALAGEKIRDVQEKLPEEQSAEEIQVLFEMALLLGEKGEYHEAREILERAEDKIQSEITDEERTRKLQNILLRYSGLFYFREGQYEQAKIRFQENASYYRDQSNRSKLARTYGYLGMTHGNMGQMERALSYHRKNLSISKEISNKRGLINANGNLGVLYWNMGDLDQSLEYHRQFLALSEEVGEKRKIGLAKGWMGIIFESKGDLERALSYYREDHSINKDIGDKRRIGLALEKVGHVYRKMGKLDQAMECQKRNLTISQEIDHHPNIASAFQEIGVIHLVRGEGDQAEQALSEARSLTTEKGTTVLRVKNRIQFAGLKRREGELDEALQEIEQVLEEVQEIDFYRPAVQAKMEHIRILVEMGEDARVRELLHKSIDEERKPGEEDTMQNDLRLFLVEVILSTKLQESDLPGELRLQQLLNAASGWLEGSYFFSRRARLDHAQALHNMWETDCANGAEEAENVHRRLRENEHHALAEELEQQYKRCRDIIDETQQRISGNGPPPRKDTEEGRETDQSRPPERSDQKGQQQRVSRLVEDSRMADFVGSPRNQEAMAVLSTVIQSDLSPDHMLEIIIDSVVDLMRAKRGFVFLQKEKLTENIMGQNHGHSDQEEEQTSSTHSGSSGKNSEGPELIPVSFCTVTNHKTEHADSAFEDTAHEIADLSLVKQVVESGEARVGEDASNDDDFVSFSTVHQLDLKSVLVAPITRSTPVGNGEDARNQQETIGVIYLDDPSHPAKFTDDDLSLLSAVCRELAGPLEHALEHERNRRRLEQVEEKYQQAKQELQTRYSYENIVGKSEPMQDVYDVLDKVKETDLNVIVEGETGTGKELASRAIHYNGPRKEQPFLAVNCARFSEDLLESELFGHEKGAFTDASEQKKGLFEQADGGTLFLDEVGEMSPSMQSRLLRVLETEEVRRVGGETTFQVDVRIICATNRDLETSINKGRFREDLYYRLAHATVKMPPLEDRREDIPLLIDYFLEELTEEKEAPKPSFSDDLMTHLMKREWPGNVRQLRSVVRQCYLFADNQQEIGLEVMEQQHFREEESETQEPKQAQEEREDTDERTINPAMPLDELEKQAIREALRKTDGKKSEAAEILDIHRNTLRRKIEKYDIDDEIPF